eukprot:13578412-Alexandrium_andersonii.AAC.1
MQAICERPQVRAKRCVAGDPQCLDALVHDGVAKQPLLPEVRLPDAAHVDRQGDGATADVRARLLERVPHSPKPGQVRRPRVLVRGGEVLLVRGIAGGRREDRRIDRLH